MPAWIKQVLRLLVFGNCWVSFAAVCLYWETALLHHLEFSSRLSISIFGATLFIYNYHRLFRKRVIYSVERSTRHRWIVSNDKLLTGFAVLGGLTGFISFLPYFTQTFFLRILPFLLIALLYVVPVGKRNGKWFSLRDLPFLKIFLVAAVWAFVTAFIPFLSRDAQWLPTASVWLTFAHRFVFIFAITLPFDVRDLAHDRKYGVVTFASRFGVNGIKSGARLLLVFIAAAGLCGYLAGWYSPGQGLGLVISAASTGWLISRMREDSDEWYYAGFLDGTMVDQLFWIFVMGLVG